MRLTRRGRILRDSLALLLALVAFLVAVTWAWETGQNKQCAWFRQHGTPQQARAYCTAGGR